MATSATKNETTTDAKPTNKLRKPPMSAYKRIDGQLKRAAVSAKISKDELTKISVPGETIRLRAFCLGESGQGTGTSGGDWDAARR